MLFDFEIFFDLFVVLVNYRVDDVDEGFVRV